MYAEIKEMYSLDIDGSLENYSPKDIYYFELELNLVVGIAGQKGGDLFRIIVCSSKWINDRIINENIIFGRGLLIVHEYNYNLIQEKLAKYIYTCSGNSWNTIASKIAKVCYWEFDDYSSSQYNLI